MCVICLQWDMYKDLNDARKMLVKARTEPTAIDEEHLKALETFFNITLGGIEQ